jgi:hypothetical protein
VHCRDARHENTLTQTLRYATHKEADIDQQQHSSDTLICQRHQTMLTFLPLLPQQTYGGVFANFIVRPLISFYSSSLLLISRGINGNLELVLTEF